MKDIFLLMEEGVEEHAFEKVFYSIATRYSNWNIIILHSSSNPETLYFNSSYGILVDLLLLDIY